MAQLVEPALDVLRNMHVRETVRENHMTAILAVHRNAVDAGHENMLISAGSSQCNVYCRLRSRVLERGHG